MATADYFREEWIHEHAQGPVAANWPGEAAVGGSFGAVTYAGAVTSPTAWLAAESVANWGPLANCPLAGLAPAPVVVDPPLPPIWPWPSGLIYGREYFAVTQYMTRGDTYAFAATIKMNGAAYDLTGTDLTFTAKWEFTDPDVDAVITLTSPSGGVSIVSAALGQIRVVIPPEATESLPAHETQLKYDIQVKTSGGDIYTVLQGLLVVRPDVTVS